MTDLVPRTVLRHACNAWPEITGVAVTVSAVVRRRSTTTPHVYTMDCPGASGPMSRARTALAEYQRIP